MLIDDIIDAAAKDPRIKQAVEQAVHEVMLPTGSNTMQATHTFTCVVGQTPLEVVIVFKVATRRKY